MRRVQMTLDVFSQLEVMQAQASEITKLCEDAWATGMLSLTGRVSITECELVRFSLGSSKVKLNTANFVFVF